MENPCKGQSDESNSSFRTGLAAGCTILKNLVELRQLYRRFHLSIYVSRVWHPDENVPSWIGKLYKLVRLRPFT
uniref:Uncharacterized protein n=1 Tax=Salix viminalis TaxID=40686 RepID=A0A6N2M396_SALVM